MLLVTRLLLDHAREIRHYQETQEIANERGRLDRVIGTLLFMAAIRRSEVGRLIWEDIDFARDELAYVAAKQSKSSPHGELEVIRVLSRRGAQALRDLRSDREHEPLSARVVPLTGESINRHFQKCCKSIGLEG